MVSCLTVCTSRDVILFHAAICLFILPRSRTHHTPLYKINTKELETTKQYLLENLNKGFIETSQVSFIALVFFVKKPNRSLWFYIDYRKLNSFS
jgi:hypothetical protein